MPHCTTKTCSKCGETKPATSEYFYRAKGASDGLRPDCKVCFNEKQRVYNEANKERIAESKRIYREANKERAAEYQRAYYQAHKKEAVERARKWGIANPEKKRQSSRSYTKRNRERVLAKNRAYHAANKEREAEYARAYYAENKEHILKRSHAYYTSNKEQYAEYQRVSLATNPERHRLHVRIRRARRLKAEGSHTAEDIQRQYQAQKGKCYYCQCKVGDNYHVDHVIPLARGGSNSPENLVISCPNCNQSKGAKLPSEWAQGGRLL